MGYMTCQICIDYDQNQCVSKETEDEIDNTFGHEALMTGSQS